MEAFHPPAYGGDLNELRHTYSDQTSVLRAARSEWKRLQSCSATLSYTLARARPDLIPELTYSLHGVKDEIAAIIWYGGNLLHSLTDQGFTTALELEAKLPDDLVSDLAEPGAGYYTGILAWYRDDTTRTDKTLTAGDQTKPRRLPFLYANKSTAKRAVDRELLRLPAP